MKRLVIIWVLRMLSIPFLTVATDDCVVNDHVHINTTHFPFVVSCKKLSSIL